MRQIYAEWKHFTSGNRKAEGRLIHPLAPCGDLVLFCPGFPGGGATLFEQRFVDRLLEEEYTVCVLRHNGTRLDTPEGQWMLNSQQYPKAVPFHDGKFIGGASSSVREWIGEPQTVLETLGAEFSEIIVVGHSFGAVTALNSLCGLNENGSTLLERIQKVILLAPAVGLLHERHDDVMDTLWQDEFIMSDLVTSRVTLNSCDEIKRDLNDVYHGLASRAAQLPEHMSKVFVHVERDEYIRRDDVEEFARFIDRDSQFFIDKFDRHDPRLGIDAHDMPHFPQQILLDLIEGNNDAYAGGPNFHDGFLDN